MNFTSAMASLRDGEAVKPLSWAGYVERIDEVYEAYNPNQTTTYQAESQVSYNGRRYVALVSVYPDPVSRVVGPFDQSKWTSLDSDYYIVAVDTSGTGPSSGCAAIYKCSYWPGEPVEYTRLSANAPVPQVVKARHSTWTTVPSPVDMPDVRFFVSMLDTSWNKSGSAAYESARSRGSRW